MESVAASENTKIPMPHVEKMAVVTGCRVRDERAEHFRDSQCPGIALRRAIRAILKPPSRTTLAKHAYEIFVFSSFSPLERQQNLKALEKRSVNRTKHDLI
jgi:hypothetical protein